MLHFMEPLKKLVFVLFVLICIGIQGKLFCQERLHIDTSYTPQQIVDSVLVRDGMRVSNVSFQGLKIGMGYFQIDTNVIGMKSGVLLSTGNVIDIARPNQNPNTSGIVSDHSIKFHSDKDLDRICKGKIYDQVILEFDFVPYNNHISFQFCFASEEYNEYVGSQFNDVFAFIISGQGIKGKNLAVIPGTNVPITINTINNKIHSDLFIDNDCLINTNSGQSSTSFYKRIWAKLFYKKQSDTTGIYINPHKKKKLNQVLLNNFEYDGFTKTMTASCYVTPWKKYHLKIAIGDVGDESYDSGVFLKGGSFSTDKDTTQKGFKPYADLLNKINWDSVFRKPNVRIVVSKKDSIRESEDEKFQVSNVNFTTDNSSLADSAARNLDMLAEYLLRNKKLKCELKGYTDNKGTKKHNQKLSENRAEAVMNYLITKGIDKQRMNYTGNNSKDPVESNGTERGRALNRRVEIIVIDEE